MTRPLTVYDDGRVAFFRTRHGRTVHVFDRYDVPGVYTEIAADEGYTPEQMTALHIVMGRPYARCGAEGPSQTAVEGFVETFADDALCVSCRRSVSDDDAHLLFEHPTSEEEVS